MQIRKYRNVNSHLIFFPPFNVSARRTNERGSPESPGLERMPAEMYVPNQEQWLELRASKRYNFCCTEY